MNILAIDQANHMGWCCGDDLYGVWDLTTRKDESIGMKLIRFKAKLIEILVGQEIELVVYERIAGQFKSSLIHAAKLVAIIETVCETRKIAYKAYSAKEIKLFATGKGTASKEMMIQAAKDKHGYTGNNDNEADAIFIYQLAKSEFNNI